MSGDVPRPKRILLLEDNERFVHAVSDMLRGECVIMAHADVNKAYAFVRGDVYFAAIVVDGDLGRGIEESIHFVKNVAPIFQGPLIACSANREYVRLLREAGCTHETQEKYELPTLLLELLKA